jgi:hypothetical protein
MPFYKKRGGNGNGLNQTASEDVPSLSKQYWQEAYAAMKSQVFFEGIKDLGNGPYHIEIFVTHTQDLVMTAQHQERAGESFVIEIRGQEKVDSLVNKEFGGDFDRMASHLKIMNKRMVLLNPRFLKK